MVPFLNFDNARFPIHGGLLQRRGGTVRHDAVAWGYARAADRRGVDIIQNCEVKGFRIEDNRVVGVETIARLYRCRRRSAWRSPATHHASRRWPDLRLPIESHVLQAFVSESIKPFIDGVVTFGAGHFYISQSDKGGLVFGGDLDGYNSYAQRGNLPVVEDVCEGGMALMPRIGRVRLLRSWGGIMDMSMDGSPIIDRTPIARTLFQWRLVLRRLQGDAGVRLVLRASHRARRTACRRQGLSPRSLRDRTCDRRKGHGPAPQSSLKQISTKGSDDADHLPLLRRTRPR